MNDKILSLLGICRRAGKLVIGAAPIIEAVTGNKARLIVFANDFSKNSAKPVREKALEKNVTILTVNRNKAEISNAVGKLCGAAAIIDEGFAKKLAQLIENEDLGGV